MISVIPNDNSRYYQCLSTDTKPTIGVGNGSQLIEIDTGNIYLFDAENGVWLLFNFN